ncbi:FAD-dependent oxidoreductase [Streptomyces diacarni]|uniref:FAD-dependent oxidoreductase n=1 Tax=Streptomyces diacarni TaxID=2800381 RepID=UPI001FE9E969|nr:FAD-dependent oxidoreductase [Streptomyces diacarni]
MRPGRDRRAVRHTATPGDPHAPRKPRNVAVIGGGIAGITAATALAERGVRVDLFEGQASLGGRLAGWPSTLRDGSQVTMSRGFHAFFRQYYNLRALLRRVDPQLESLSPVPDYPLWHSAGHHDSFAGLPRTPPWNVAAFILRSPTFSMADLKAIDRQTALSLFNVGVPETYRRLDHLDARTYLRSMRFPERAHHLAFEVFSRSFFADPSQLSAAELAVMFHLYFLGSSEGLLFDVPTRPFPQALWEPLGDYLRAHHVSIHTRTPVKRLVADTTHELTVETEDSGPQGGLRGQRFDGVVLAMDTDGLKKLVASSPNLGTGTWRRRIDQLRTAPPFQVTRLWLDRPLDSTRPAFLGTADCGPLDNISVLNRYEQEAQAWAERRNGAVVELHAYALPGSQDAARTRERLLEELRRIYPETASARVVDERTEVRADCPLFPVGQFDRRPTVATPDPRVMCAGDLVRVDLPVALMERAATSGFQAANALLARWKLPGHDIWSVPTGGRARILRAAAARTSVRAP